MGWICSVTYCTVTQCTVGLVPHGRYQLYANINQAWWRDPSTKTVITVLPSSVPAPPPSLLRAASTTSDASEIFGCDCLPCCQCCSKGSGAVEMALDRQVYAVGEPIAVTAMAKNDTDDEGTLSVKLVTVARLSTRRGITVVSANELEMYTEPVPARSTTEWRATSPKVRSAVDIYQI